VHTKRLPRADARGVVRLATALGPSRCPLLHPFGGGGAGADSATIWGLPHRSAHPLPAGDFGRPTIGRLHPPRGGGCILGVVVVGGIIPLHHHCPIVRTMVVVTTAVAVAVATPHLGGVVMTVRALPYYHRTSR